MLHAMPGYSVLSPNNCLAFYWQLFLLPHPYLQLSHKLKIQRQLLHVCLPACGVALPSAANILLARDGTAKLADVGLAKTAATKDYLTAVHTMGYVHTLAHPWHALLFHLL